MNFKTSRGVWTKVLFSSKRMLVWTQVREEMCVKILIISGIRWNQVSIISATISEVKLRERFQVNLKVATHNIRRELKFMTI